MKPMRLFKAALILLGLGLIFLCPAQQKMKSGGDDTTKPQPKSLTTLKVTQFTGEFINWVNDITITEPQLVTFFSTTKQRGVAWAKYEISTMPWPGPHAPAALQPNIIHSGVLKNGSSGPGMFDIDFKKFVPAKPPPVSKAIRYHVRVTMLGALGAPLGLPSPAVRVTYREYTGEPTVIEDVEQVPESLFTPLPIVIKLDTFSCPDADEDDGWADGDEPYLFVVVILADGTTINPLNFPGSSVRLRHKAKTHENLNLDGVDSGPGNYYIPPGTGRFETTILPVGLNVLNLIPDGKKVETVTDAAMVGILVVAMEEDDSTDSTANAGRNALVSNLQKELDAIVHALKPSADTQLNPAQIMKDLKPKLTAKVEDAMTHETLKNWWNPVGWFAIVDPDDHIDSDFESFTYKQIWEAGEVGVPFVLDFNGGGAHYEVYGRVSAK